MDLTIEGKKSIEAVIKIPGDKSISHRSVIIAGIAAGVSEIGNFLPGHDCRSTVSCMRQLGVKIEEITPSRLRVTGNSGILGEPQNSLDVGNSGTTIRLLAGLLAGQNFFAVVTGDNSIRNRPMKRVVDPLKLMGAGIWGRQGGRFAPLAINGGKLRGIEYRSPIASAQVKSAVLLAGLYAKNETIFTEPALSRDHTEKMLASFGAKIKCAGPTTIIRPGMLTARDMLVPGDISSASFFTVLGAIIPDAKITIKSVGLNPTRTGILDVLQAMGAEIAINNERKLLNEPIGDIIVEGGNQLRGVVIGGDLIPRLIDEIPVLAVAAAVANGKTVIKDAAELKVKESNRLKSIVTELTRFGVMIRETADGLIINGGRKYEGAVCNSYNDHRIAMACVLMGLIARGRTTVKGAECIDISFPGFKQLLEENL